MIVGDHQAVAFSPVQNPHSRMSAYSNYNIGGGKIQAAVG
jgi:hypothetical protein